MSLNLDRLVTVFGGGGFIGRYLVPNLLRAGWRVRVAGRDPRRALFLKTHGGVGQSQFVAADIRRPESAARAARGSDAVVNLVGVLAGQFDAIHVEGAANIARAAADAGARTLVHVSAIGASADSPSAYGRSKAGGEAAARAAFPAVTIVRPSIVFGPEDDFVNRFAKMARRLPVVPVAAPGARFQPVYVADLARALCACVTDPDAHRARTYELGGPQVLTMAELIATIARLIGAGGKPLLPLPDALVGGLARFAGFLPGAPITNDQWKMLQVPNVADGAGFDAFGIRPQPLEAVAETWLTAYRRGGRFAQKSPTS